MEQKSISGKNNQFITDIRKLKQKKFRNRTGLFYVEGKKLFKEALNSGLCIRYIICTKNSVPEASSLQIVTVTEEAYKKITDEQSPEGIMCVLEIPKDEIYLSYKKPVIALCSVRDPGNVGTIIRTANALCDADMIISEDCADIYSAKTQRAAMGAVFRQNIKTSGNIAEDISALKKNGYRIYAAYLDKCARQILEVGFTEKTAVIFGNEGGGLDDFTANLCDEKMIIPINPQSDSLNVSVAAGIVLWEMGKNLRLRREN